MTDRQIREVNRLRTEITRKRYAEEKAQERLKKAQAWEAQAHTLVVQRDDELADIQQQLLELSEDLDEAEARQHQSIEIHDA